MKGSFFVALAAALLLAQGADAVQPKKITASKKKVAATKSVKAKHAKKVPGSKSSSTTSASDVTASGAAAASSSSASLMPAAAGSSATSKAKASTVLSTIRQNVGVDFYNLLETNMRETNTTGSKISGSDNYVGLSYKVADTAKIYLRQMYVFDVPSTGNGTEAGTASEMNMHANDIYLRYQNSKFFQVLNDGSIGGRVTLTLPTGEASRSDAAKMHNGKLSARATFVKPVSKLFSWDYLIQGGYNNMLNKGVRNKEGELKGTTQFAYVQNLGLNFEVGGGFTLTQGIGTTGAWTNETEEFGVEQTNKIALGTSIGRAFGPALINVGVSQEGNIMSDAGAERWSLDDLYDDASTSYYLEFAMSI